jgi:glycosidase
MDRPPPPWVAGRTWYQVHALRATGAPDVNPDVFGAPSGDHALRRLLPWLDHVAGLGCGGLLLTPVHAAATHGYDTVDPFRLDPRLGDDGDIDALVAACHERDLRLLLDGVFNHVGRQFPAFADVVEHGAASPWCDWFRLDFDGDDGDGFAYKAFEGHHELVALDHRNPAVLDWATSVCTHWLDRGIDGWRFDVAYAIPRPFLAELSRRVLDHRPDAFLFGEMIHGDYAGFVSESGLHSVTQYELHKASWSACNDANAFELAWSLRRHAEMAERFVPVTFAGNHDVARLASQLTDPDRDLETVLQVLFAVPGTPCVYYGDEWAARGAKGHGPGADDAIRPRFDELRPDPAVEDLHRRLIALRRERAWLTDAHLEVTAVANQRLELRVTARHGDGELLLELRFGDTVRNRE